MSETLGMNFQDIQIEPLPRLGLAASSTNETIIDAIDAESDRPFRLSATFPTNDANLNITAAKTAKGDGSNRAPSNFQSGVNTAFVATTINFLTQAIVGGTVTITWPTATVGQYYRCALSLLSSGAVQAIFSAGASSVGALTNAGSLFAPNSLGLGWVDLIATASNAFQSATAGSAIIQNADIYNMPATMDTEIEKYTGQLRLSASTSNAARALLSGTDFSLLSGAIFSQGLSQYLLNFSGSQIDFSTGNVYLPDGVTALGNNFTPFTIPTGQYIWYAVSLVASTLGGDNRIGGLLNISASSAAFNLGSDIYPTLPTGAKIGLVQVFNNSGTIQVTAIRQFAPGSGASLNPIPTGNLPVSANGYQLPVNPLNANAVIVFIDQTYAVPTLYSIVQVSGSWYIQPSPALDPSQNVSAFIFAG